MKFHLYFKKTSSEWRVFLKFSIGRNRWIKRGRGYKKERRNRKKKKNIYIYIYISISEWWLQFIFSTSGSRVSRQEEGLKPCQAYEISSKTWPTEMEYMPASGYVSFWFIHFITYFFSHLVGFTKSTVSPHTKVIKKCWHSHEITFMITSNVHHPCQQLLVISHKWFKKFEG